MAKTAVRQQKKVRAEASAATARRTPKSKVEGYLAIGINEQFEVVINLDRDRNGFGHLVFSPTQARGLARVLNSRAKAADIEYRAAIAAALATVGPAGMVKPTKKGRESGDR